MTDNIALRLDTTGLSSGLSAAGAEIARVAESEIAPAAALIEDAFASAASAIERSLLRAARSGELSLKGLAQSIVRNLKNLAIDSLVRQPIESFLLSALSAPFGGARAGGGLVASGQSFLVGERGPELFTPHASGRISNAGAAPINISITLPGVTDPESFRQSETQIAAAMARALGRGQRNL
jgi:phage-related minor tail protein